MDIRTLGGQHWYNPNRDFIPLVIQLCRETCLKMTKDSIESNHAISELVKQAGVTEAHMAKAAECLAKFILIASEESHCTTLPEAIGRSGLLELPQPILAVMFSLIAQSVLGRFWSLIRSSALPELVAPEASKEALLSSSELMRKIFSNKTNMDLANALRDMKKWAHAPMH